MEDTQPTTQPSPRAVAAPASQEAAVQSVQRAVWILNCFSREQPELGVTEISRQLGLHKSTVSRLLTALRHEGLVTRAPRNGKYRLGVAVVRLAGVALESLRLTEVSEAPMLALVAETGESVRLVIAEGDRCVALRTVPSPQLVQVVKPSSWDIPLMASAAGRVLLALAPGSGAQQKRRSAPETDSDVLTTAAPHGDSRDAILAAVRETGCAIVRGEWLPDLVEVAMPIWDHQTRVIGALEVSGPAYRMRTEHIDAVLASLRRATRQIGDALGHVA